MHHNGLVTQQLVSFGPTQEAAEEGINMPIRTTGLNDIPIDEGSKANWARGNVPQVRKKRSEKRSLYCLCLRCRPLNRHFTAFPCGIAFSIMRVADTGRQLLLRVLHWRGFDQHPGASEAGQQAADAGCALLVRDERLTCCPQLEWSSHFRSPQLG